MVFETDIFTNLLFKMDQSPMADREALEESLVSKGSVTEESLSYHVENSSPYKDAILEYVVDS